MRFRSSSSRALTVSTHGVPFRAFTSHRISGSVRDGIARMSEVREQMSWRQRVRRERLRSLSDMAAGNMQTAEATEKLAEIAVGLALGFMLEGSGLFTQGEKDEGGSPSFPGTAYDSLAWKETVAQLETELSALPEREQTILRQHYLGGMNFDQLASLLAVSKGRVSQLHRAALQLLRKRLGERNRFNLRK
jgi:RNA polymerase sigma factor for flagellar operon FliA